ncbi:DgyrCDS13307 [Dimorphilus gyrociliatus]|uniref:DgyrCDS13307 n=1 Tax=Dimorphilus gyrociliatus TaxID=2664684 RepID=A0A7I8WAE2_9ANNE|nr:DgyrCDS13307 [Dimorphilus gyrociliatus]
MMKLSSLFIVCLLGILAPCYSNNCQSTIKFSNWTLIDYDGKCFGYGQLFGVKHYGYFEAQRFCKKYNGKLASISSKEKQTEFGREIKFAIKYDAVYTVFDDSEAFFWVDLVNNTDTVKWGDGTYFKQSVSPAKSSYSYSYLSKYLVVNVDYEGRMTFYNEYHPYDVRNAVCEFFNPGNKTQGNSTGVGDPHMSHYIRSADKSICYDLTGKAEDEFILLDDKKNHIIISGILLDDYYFHSIKIRMGNKTVIAHTNPLKSTISWNRNLQIYKSLTIRRINQNELLISIDRHTSFVLTKAKSIGEAYINIWIQTFDETNAGGIFGDVAKNNYEFFESSQRGQRGSVQVNGRIFPAEFRHEPKNCWFMSPENALFPKKPVNYIDNLQNTPFNL